MAYSLHTNGVITGSLNSFCLACDHFLESEQEARDHTKMIDHKKNLSAVQYSDKFQDEHIRKFKWGYYCEFCNSLFPIVAKVNLHLNEDGHKQNKNTHLLKQMGDDVVAFDNIVIGAKAWHGFVDDICSICNVEYDDEIEHKSDAGHCLNLVLKPVQFAENAVYRHLDESSVQCLTCNKLFAPSRMSEHFNGTEHNELFSKRRIETKGVSKKIEDNKTSLTENDQKKDEPKINSDVQTKKKTSPEETSKIMEAVVKYQCQGININLETETAFCKKCSDVIPFEFMEIEQHINTHSSGKKPDAELLYPPNVDQKLNRVNINDKTTNKTEDLKVDTEFYENQNEIDSNDEEETNPSGCSTKNNNSKTSQTEASDFAEENQITLNEGTSDAYCRICSVKLPSPLKSMQEHVAGANHKKMATNHKKLTKTSVPERIPMMLKQETKYFIDTVFHIENFFFYECLINEEFCIPQYSYWLISKINPRWRCILCEETISSQRLINAHAHTKQHVSKMEKLPVIISEESEFIREIRPGLYHCGYCHIVVSGWLEMKKHLRCEDHKHKRTAGECRMQMHYPAVQRHKMERNMEAMRLMWFLNRLSD